MAAPTISNLVSEIKCSRPMANAYAEIIDASVTFSDAESNFNGATVTLSGYGLDNQLTEDQLGIRDQGLGAGLISVVGHHVNYGGVLIGNYTGGLDGSPLVVTLNGNATASAVDALIQNLTYGNTSDTPTADRDLLLNVRDAAGQDFGFVGTGFTQLVDAANPFNGLGSTQLSFQVAPTLFDYDNDGDLDLFSGGDDGQVRAFQNNGLGAFTQLTGSSNPFNGFDIGEGSAITFADMDGDGDKDAFITNGLDGWADRWTNNGNGTFTDAGAVSGFYRGDSQNARPAAFDVDGDGLQDFVIGGYDGKLRVWHNDGDGTVTEMLSNPFTGISLSAGSYPAPTFADVDYDGDLDLLLGDSNGHVFMWSNNNGVFTRLDPASDPFAGITVGQNATPIWGDIDGDDDPDLIIGSSYGTTGRLETWRNDGIGWGKVIHVTVDPDAYFTGTSAADTFDAFTSDNWTISGGGGNDRLAGFAGNDTINGGTGADVLRGGDGDDIYVVDNAGDSVTEGSGAGTDLVKSSVTFTLGTNVENLTLTGTANANGTGNSLTNVLIGNGGANTLDGKGGADTMKGGAGSDTYVVDNVGDVVTEGASAGNDTVLSSISYTLGINVEKLTLTGTGSINATGNTLGNLLIGNAGNNILDGVSGSDTMQGGAGNDTYFVNSAGDVVTETASNGDDVVVSTISYTLTGDVERLTLTGASNLLGTGNALANVLTGNAGNNTLDGAAGADTMVGGLGNDTYVVDNVADIVTEAASAGTDLVKSSVSFVMAGNVENLTLTGSAAINGSGNSLANTIVGNSATNVLNGGSGDDVLTGSGGDDKLYGGLGNDTLTGGSGLDQFVFHTTLDATTNVDSISSYSVAEDTIVLDQTIFSAIASLGTLSASAFFAGAAAHDADDRVIYDAASGNIFYDADGNGAGGQVLFAHVTHDLAMTNADFLIVT